MSAAAPAVTTLRRPAARVEAVETGSQLALFTAALVAEERGIPRTTGPIDRVRATTAGLVGVPDFALADRAASIGRNSPQWSSRADLHVEALALFAESARRTHGFTLRDAQIAAAFSLLEGRIVELGFGEGKTLAVALAAFVFALRGKGVHLASATTFLAERLFAIVAPIYELLGLSVALLPESQDRHARRAAYAADVTCAVAVDLVSDFLRDRIVRRAHGHGSEPHPELVQRGLAACVIDDADTVLIDAADSPVSIPCGPAEASRDSDIYRRANAVALRLGAGEHYMCSRTAARIALTSEGEERALEFLTSEIAGRIRRPWGQYIEAALHARFLMRRGHDYLVRSGTVTPTDDETGRPRSNVWRAGMQQAIEVCVGAEITEEDHPHLTVTRPGFFRQYRHVCGVASTVCEASTEIRASYGLATDTITPTHPDRCTLLPDRVFATSSARLAAIGSEILSRRASGQPTLIFVPTVPAAESLAEVLVARGVPLRVLPGRQDEDEAIIMARAGEAGAVTIAANLAGRSVSIPVSQNALAAGGLHVIGLTRQASARLDRQIIGRTARSGLAGSVQFFLALDDDLLSRHASELLPKLTQLRSERGGELPGSVSTHFQRAQKRAELIDRDHRRALARYDEWLTHETTKTAAS